MPVAFIPIQGIDSKIYECSEVAYKVSRNVDEILQADPAGILYAEDSVRTDRQELDWLRNQYPAPEGMVRVVVIAHTIPGRGFCRVYCVLKHPVVAVAAYGQYHVLAEAAKRCGAVYFSDMQYYCNPRVLNSNYEIANLNYEYCYYDCVVAGKPGDLLLIRYDPEAAARRRARLQSQEPRKAATRAVRAMTVYELQQLVRLFNSRLTRVGFDVLRGNPYARVKRDAVLDVLRTAVFLFRQVYGPHAHRHLRGWHDFRKVWQHRGAATKAKWDCSPKYHLLFKWLDAETAKKPLKVDNNPEPKSKRYKFI